MLLFRSIINNGNPLLGKKNIYIYITISLNPITFLFIISLLEKIEI